PLDPGVTETVIECSNCLMCDPQKAAPKKPYSPKLKCCTYFPFLPNFSIGELLASGDAAVRLRWRQAADRGRVTPAGLLESSESKLRSEILGEEAFGRSTELLCPFFNSASENCTIWNNRPGVCVSFHCRSSYGEAGLEFWSRMNRYLNFFEWSLAKAVL